MGKRILWDKEEKWCGGLGGGGNKSWLIWACNTKFLYTGYRADIGIYSRFVWFGVYRGLAIVSI